MLIDSSHEIVHEPLEKMAIGEWRWWFVWTRWWMGCLDFRSGLGRTAAQPPQHNASWCLCWAIISATEPHQLEHGGNRAPERKKRNWRNWNKSDFNQKNKLPVGHVTSMKIINVSYCIVWHNAYYYSLCIYKIHSALCWVFRWWASSFASTHNKHIEIDSHTRLDSTRFESHRS